MAKKRKRNKKIQRSPSRKVKEYEEIKKAIAKLRRIRF